MRSEVKDSLFYIYKSIKILLSKCLTLKIEDKLYNY